MSDEPEPVYVCEARDFSGFPTHDAVIWRGLPRMELLQAVTGAKARLSTTVEAFWSAESLCFRFTCEDDHVVATMLHHDDPIYEEDVVEVFLSETGSLREYKEFEVSPTNVRFDAVIQNDLQGSVQIDLDWDALGWRTEVTGRGRRLDWTCVWEIPFVNFSCGTPAPGDQWRMNCYRIDRNARHGNELLAWSPTRVRNFHVPERFGSLRFDA